VRERERERERERGKGRRKKIEVAANNKKSKEPADWENEYSSIYFMVHIV